MRCGRTSPENSRRLRSAGSISNGQHRRRGSPFILPARHRDRQEGRGRRSLALRTGPQNGGSGTHQCRGNPQARNRCPAGRANIAQQLERRVRHQRAMRRVMQNAMRLGAQGIKVRVAGRLNGAEIARSETYADGRVPLHTLRQTSITPRPKPRLRTASSASRCGYSRAKSLVQTTRPPGNEVGAKRSGASGASGKNVSHAAT